MAEHPTSRAGPAPPLQKKSESSPEEKLKEVEQQVNALLEQSAFAAVRQILLLPRPILPSFPVLAQSACLQCSGPVGVNLASCAQRAYGALLAPRSAPPVAVLTQAKGDVTLALQRAKEAGKKERTLCTPGVDMG